MKLCVRVSIVLIALIASVLLGGCEKQQSEPFRIAFNTWLGYGPFYIAEEQGIFDELGLEVELIRMEGTGERRAAMIAGRVDALGSTIDDFVVGLSQGLDATMVLVVDESYGADGIIAGPGISELSDLVGKRVAVQPGFVNHFFLLYLLDSIGEGPASFNLIPMEPDKAASALFTGDVDVAVTWEPHLSVVRQNKNFSLVVTTRDPVAQHLILDNLVVDEDVLQQRETDVQAVVKGWFLALDFLKSDPTTAGEILARQFELPQDEVLEILGGVRFPTAAENIRQFDRESDRNVYQLAEQAVYLYREAGLISGAASIPALDQSFDNRFVAAVPHN